MGPTRGYKYTGPVVNVLLSTFASLFTHTLVAPYLAPHSLSPRLARSFRCNSQPSSYLLAQSSLLRPLSSPANEGAITPRGIANGITQLGVAGSDAAAAVGDVGNGVFQGLAIAGAGAVEAAGAGAAAAAERRSPTHSANPTDNDNENTVPPLGNKHSDERRDKAPQGIADGIKEAGDAVNAIVGVAAGVGGGIAKGAATFGADAVLAAGQGAAAAAGCVTDDEWSMPKPAVSCNADNIEQFTYHCANDKNAQDPALMAACLTAHKCPIQESSSKGAIGA
ncbi:hypothetical protein HWV62_11381 [Athelia sp. TMB]|nr:hypothetical protein HWV62_11381 [Athelia sp. TMB]